MSTSLTSSRPQAEVQTGPATHPGARVRASRVGNLPWVEVGGLLAIVGAAHTSQVSVCTAALLVLLTVPGDLLRRALGVVVTTLAERAVLALSASLGVQYAIILGLQLWGARVGPVQSLQGAPVLGCETGVLVVLLLLSRRRGAGPPGPSPLTRVVSALLAVLVLPVAAAVGAARLDAGAGPSVALGATAVAILWLLVAWALGGRARVGAGAPFAMFAFAVTVALGISMRGTTVYGYDVHQEFAAFVQTAQAGRWVAQAGDPYSAMLSITALPTLLWHLTGLQPLLFFKLVGPLTLGLYAVGVMELVRRFAGVRFAIVVTALVVVTSTGYWSVTGVVRQQFGLLTALAVVQTLTVARGSRRSRTALAVWTGLTCVASHYSTSYVLCALVVGACAVLLVMRLPDRRRGIRGPLPISLVVPVTLLAGVYGWDMALTHSTTNISRTVNDLGAQGVGLRGQGSLVQLWLNGTTPVQVSTSRFFEMTGDAAAIRPWLRAYPTGVQHHFPVADATATPNVPLLPGGGAVDLAFTLMRQATQLGCALVLLLALAGWVMGRWRPSASQRAIMALAAAALVVTSAMRLSTSLSLAYNPERLAIQTLPLIAAASGGWLVPRLRLWSAQRRQLQDAGSARPAAWRPVALGAGLALLVAGLADGSGARALLFSGRGDSLAVSGEAHDRYHFEAQDVAAVGYLQSKWTRQNMVFTDNYGQLLLKEHPRFQSGVLPVMTPQLLDQRAFVLATHSNHVSGQLRLSMDGVIARSAFPTSFLNQYKGVMYSNGSAVVYR